MGGMNEVVSFSNHSDGVEEVAKLETQTPRPSPRPVSFLIVVFSFCR